MSVPSLWVRRNDTRTLPLVADSALSWCFLRSRSSRHVLYCGNYTNMHFCTYVFVWCKCTIFYRIGYFKAVLAGRTCHTDYGTHSLHLANSCRLPGLPGGCISSINSKLPQLRFRADISRSDIFTSTSFLPCEDWHFPISRLADWLAGLWGCSKLPDVSKCCLKLIGAVLSFSKFLQVLIP